MITPKANCGHEPIDLLVITQSGSFIKADYPKMTHLVITMKGADGGTASDETPSPGQEVMTILSAIAVPDRAKVEIGKPGRPDGKPGYILVEVYDCGCA